MVAHLEKVVYLAMEMDIMTSTHPIGLYHTLRSHTINLHIVLNEMHMETIQMETAIHTQ